MADSGRQTPRSSQRSKTTRTQKIQPMASAIEEHASTTNAPPRASSTAPPASASSNAVSSKASTAASISSTEGQRRRREERDRSASTTSTSSASTSIGGNSSSMPPVRSHTPGHLSSKSHDRKRKPSELSIRQRSQSSSSLSAAAAASNSAGVPLPPTSNNGSKLTASPSSSHASIVSPPTSSRTTALPPLTITTSASTPLVRPPPRGGSTSASSTSTGNREYGANGSGSVSDSSTIQGLSVQPTAADSAQRRPTAMRSTSAIASKPSVYGGIAGPISAASRSSSSVGAHGSSARETQRSKGGVTAGKKAPNKEYFAFPTLPVVRTGPDVAPAPSTGMYWSQAPLSGVARSTLRAHTTTPIGTNIFVFGGCDATTCFNDLYVLDGDSFHWSKPHVVGDIPLPLRAMTCTAVGKKLVVFGGGDGPQYYNDVYVLDTTNFRWSKPRFPTDRPRPSPRRAHTACLYRGGIFIFGGGDGKRALNDVWRLDVSDTTKMSWKLINGDPDLSLASGTGIVMPGKAGKGDKATRGESGAEAGNNSDTGSHGTAVAGGTSAKSQPISNMNTLPRSMSAAIASSASTAVASSLSSSQLYSYLMNQDPNQPRPRPRGYHTANMVGSKLVIYGGSDGGECFNDIWLYDIETNLWRSVPMSETYRRLSHTATLIGSHLFIVGGHDGHEYQNELLLLNLVTMTWDKRKVYGTRPSGRGYHTAVLFDSRLLVIGGFDGDDVYDDVWMLELAVHSYCSQISQFDILV